MNSQQQRRQHQANNEAEEDYGEEEEEEEEEKVKAIGGCGNSNEELVDVEDMGEMASRLKESLARDSASYDDAVVRIASSKKSAGNTAALTQDDDNRRPMLTPSVEKTLTKQGYKIIGSHSGVKVCRWTKAMLRGRGGCYKHTFYGIASHQCMETTPSLACGTLTTDGWMDFILIAFFLIDYN